MISEARDEDDQQELREQLASALCSLAETYLASERPIEEVASLSEAAIRESLDLLPDSPDTVQVTCDIQTLSPLLCYHLV